MSVDTRTPKANRQSRINIVADGPGTSAQSSEDPTGTLLDTRTAAANKASRTNIV